MEARRLYICVLCFKYDMYIQYVYACFKYDTYTRYFSVRVSGKIGIYVGGQQPGQQRSVGSNVLSADVIIAGFVVVSS